MNEKDVKRLILDIESSNPVDLKIKGDRNNSPKPIHYYNSNKLFIPDIVATYASRKDYYSIDHIISEADISLLTFKWILFVSEARKTSGTFYLIIDKMNSSICQNLIQSKQLDIELIEL
jgi:hypothetical protein